MEQYPAESSRLGDIKLLGPTYIGVISQGQRRTPGTPALNNPLLEDVDVPAGLLPPTTPR